MKTKSILLSFYMAVIAIIAMVIGIHVLTGCTPVKNTATSGTINPSEFKMSDEELTSWSSLNDTVFYNSEAVAIVNSIEWEYSANYLYIRLEISATQIHPYDAAITLDIIRYLHHRYPHAKIEVNFDSSQYFNR